MSEQNLAYTQDALSRLIQQFDGTVNLRALVAAYVDRVQDLEDAAWPLLGERSVSNATGDRLDGIGAIGRIDRQGRDDSTYRAALVAEFAVLRATGAAEPLLELAQLLIGMATADYEALEYYPKTFYIRPVDHALTVDPVFVGNQLKRAASAATQLLFVYSWFDDSGTFTLSSQATVVETSASLGLGSVAAWGYDSATVLAGIGSGEIRFNNANPASATQAFFHDSDLAGEDQGALLATLDGEAIVLLGEWPNLVFADVTGVTDNTGTWTLDIDNVIKTGSTFSASEIVVLNGQSDGGHLAGAA